MHKAGDILIWIRRQNKRLWPLHKKRSTNRDNRQVENFLLTLQSITLELTMKFFSLLFLSNPRLLVPWMIQLRSFDPVPGERVFTHFN